MHLSADSQFRFSFLRDPLKNVAKADAAKAVDVKAVDAKADDAKAGGLMGRRIIILLDALDEASHVGSDDSAEAVRDEERPHIGKDYFMVMRLIRDRFKELLSQVRFVLTSRVERAILLKDWKPRLIKPSEQSNMADMEIVIRARVKASVMNATGRINSLYHDQAVKLILERSEGQVSFRGLVTLSL